MANSEKSKIKTLLIYEYFLRRSEASNNTGISMPDIITYLNEMTDTEFERKSIYSDIKQINEFMKVSGLLKNSTEEWIVRDGKKYKRGELLDELTMDEARLIVDAINATPFVNSGLCDKIKARNPAYFSHGYKSLVPHERSFSNNTRFLLNNIRSCIENKEALAIDYGYIVAKGFKGVSTKEVSPLELDWEKNNYYLIAVDNSIYVREGRMENAVRRYRIDRISGHRILPDKPYYGIKEDKDGFLKKYLKSSIDSFASSDSRMITIRLTCDDEKTLLKAYSAFSDNVNIRKILSDKTDKGEIKFCFEAGLVPTLFNELFKFYTFGGVKVEIDDEEVKAKFREYLNAALKGL